MQYQSTVFGQLLKTLPRSCFERLARGHETGRKKRELSDWGHLVTMIFAQTQGARSLRDLERLLERHRGIGAHLGLGKVKRSTLADANGTRPAALFEDVARHLSMHLGQKTGCREVVRLIDATHFLAGRRIAQWSGSGGIKLHMMYELGSERPVCFAITPKRINDTVAAAAMPVEGGATYVFDKGYYHFAFWAKIDACGGRFVTRLKVNSPIRISAKREVAAGGSISFDQKRAFIGANPRIPAVRRQVTVTALTIGPKFQHFNFPHALLTKSTSGEIGAVERTRTSTSFPVTTSR